MSANRVPPTVPAGGALLSLFALLAAGGVAAGDAVALSAAVAIQTAVGAACWLLATRGRTNGIELLGVGMAIGTMATVLFAQILRAWPSARFALAALCLLAAAIALLPGNRTFIKNCLSAVEVLKGRDWIGAAGAFALGLPVIVLLWLRHPLDWSGYRTFNVDLPFQQALANSVSSFGPSESAFVSGGRSIRYHWFAHGWIGALDTWVSTEPFVVLTRLVPIVAAVGTVTVGWAWARRLSAAWWTPPLASILLIGAMYVGMSESVGDHMHRGVSPSQSLSSNWLITFALVLTLAIRRLIPRTSAATLLSGIAFALVGGKVSHAAVVVGGMLSLFMLSTMQIRRAQKLVVFFCALSALGTFAGYVVLIRGREGGNGLAFGFQRTVWARFNLDPFAGTPSLAVIGGILGALSLLAGILPRWSGLISLVRRRREFSAETMFGIGVAGTGLSMILITTQAGTAQVYFALSASLIVSVLSAVGVERAWSEARFERSQVPNKVISAVSVGAGAGLSGYLTSAVGYRVGHSLQWIAPLLVWVIVLAYFHSQLPERTARTLHARRRGMVLGIIALLAASVTSFQVVHGATLLGEALRGPDTSWETGWHSDDRAAAKWLESAANQSDIVVTNRLCTNASEVAPECSSRSFITSALAGTRMWIEGYDYGVGVGTLPDWALARVDIAKRFTASPDSDDAAVLTAAGVRWIWLDCRVDCSADLSKFGVTAFQNDHVAIIELRADV